MFNKLRNAGVPPILITHTSVKKNLLCFDDNYSNDNLHFWSDWLDKVFVFWNQES